MRCEHAHDDGAYVLGALSPSERAEFERHMADCLACREAVAEIAVLPGLLARLDPVAARQLLGTPSPTDLQGLVDDVGSGVLVDTDSPPRLAVVAGGPVSGGEPRVAALVSAAAAQRRRERRARRYRYAGAALAAACLALIAGIGVGMLRGNGLVPGGDPTTPAMVSMQEVSAKVPVTAEVRLTNRSFGTQVTMHCQYEHTGDNDGRWSLKLVALGSDGTKEQIGSWTAGPGDDVEFSGVTKFGPGELTDVLLTRADGTPLLVHHVT